MGLFKKLFGKNKNKPEEAVQEVSAVAETAPVAEAVNEPEMPAEAENEAVKTEEKPEETAPKKEPVKKTAEPEKKTALPAVTKEATVKSTIEKKEEKKTTMKKETATEKKTVAKAEAKTVAKAEAVKPAVKKADAPAKKAEAPAKAPETAEKTTVTGCFEIKKSKDDRFVFNLYASNHVIVATSQVYSSSASALVGIKSVIANAESAPIEDQTLKDYETLTYPKWEIYLDKGNSYRFRLNASNGSAICHSQGYTSKANCKNGIESIRRSVKNAEIDKAYLQKDNANK